MPFESALAVGRIGESAIARWMLRRGNMVLPAYELELAHGKGPRFFTNDGNFVAPDMLVFPRGGDRAVWAEAKHKTVWTWFRKGSTWDTGIDIRHYFDYLEVSRRTTAEVWLLFLHRCARPDRRDLAYGCPPSCPTGLFGERLTILRQCESHRCGAAENGTGHGRSGMVYWSAADLRQLATLDELETSTP